MGKFRVNSKYVQIHGTLVSGKRRLVVQFTIGIANMNREEKKLKPTICFLKRKIEAKIPMRMHSKAIFV
jgi:hypothetical protein